MSADSSTTAQSSPSETTPDLTDLTPEQQRALLARLLQAKADQARTFPMSAGQQGLWHAFRRDPNDTAFNVFLPTRIRSEVNLQALRKSLEQIAQRHAALRTTFSDAGGQLTQRVHAELVPEFQHVTMLGGDEADARALVQQEIQRPFDLQAGPLLRALVIQLAADDWIVVATTHHVVVDFWSLVLILKELRAAYPEWARGRQPQLDAAICNYAAHVEQQQALLEGPRGQVLRDYWQQQLLDTAPVIELPCDFQRPSQFIGEAAIAPLQFQADQPAMISALASRLQATSVAVVQAAVQVFVGRYAGQEKFFIGSPFAGRSRREFENTVGFFINMLPLRASLEGDPTFAELVTRASQTLVDALEHEEYPISRITHDAKITRDPSRSPLFQVSCTFEKSHVKSEAGRAGFLIPGRQQVWDFGGIQQESFYIPHPTCHYDLEFIFEQTESELRGMLCYCKHLFDADTVEQMAVNFSTLLRTLLAEPHQQLSRLNWHAVEDGVGRRSSGNRSTGKSSTSTDGASTLDAEDSSRDQTVCGLIASAASSHPQASALRCRGVQLSYQQLFRLSGRLADDLVSRGVGPEVMVPVLAAEGASACAAMLAIHLAGAACVPVDLAQPAHDLEHVVRDTQAPLLVAESGWAERLLDLNCPVLELPPLATAGALAETNEPIPCRTAPENLAYVVYTSGSTGKPKGVLVEHRSVVNTLLWRMRDVPLSAQDRVLMLLSHQFDAGLGIAWTTLTQSAELVWADADAHADPNALIDQIVRDEITVLPAIPSLLQLLVSHPRFPECQSLRLIWTGGESMPASLAEQIRRVSRAEFWNFYGPTEAAIEATACNLTMHPARRTVPIGEPIAGAYVLILDKHQNVLPDTVPGEIAIGGAGLARGYLNQPALTDERFIPDPVDATQRVYRTGDRGRRRANGQIEFLGRTDHQVKLRGYRIELGELETLLQSHYLVERAAAKVDGAGATANLLAFVQLTNPQSGAVDSVDRAAGEANLVRTLRRFLSDHLPPFKMPSALMIVQEMPLTASGKVDRGLLPDVVSSEVSAQQLIEPNTALERYLSQAWCEILGVEHIGANQNFFDAGGSSLQAAMLTNRLSEDLNIHVPTALVFDLADILQMAGRLAELYPEPLSQRFGAECIASQRAQAADVQSTTGTHPLIASLKPSGGRQPLFMVHPPGGIVVCYRELAECVAPEQPLFGIRSRGLHGHEELPATLTDMAAEYLDAIRSVQPAGPYTLGGWSLGGLVAYELARQLTAERQSVERLILLDTTIPTGATDLVPESEQVNVGLEYGIELTLDQLAELPAEEQLRFLWEHAKQLGVLQDDSSPEVVSRALEDLQHLFHHHVELARHYRLQPLDVPVLLVRPSEIPCELEVAEDRGWGHLCPNVRVHFVPGHHHSMVQQPHVRHVAQVLQNP